MRDWRAWALVESCAWAMAVGFVLFFLLVGSIK